MASSKYNLLELEIEKLFEELKIEEIVVIEQSLQKEIEKKKDELRSMVSNRYKDILTASDSIKYMKEISEKIVDSIQNISDACETLITNGNSTKPIHYEEKKVDIKNRTLAVQIRLAMQVNEDIWMYLDKEDNLNAVQLYLLGQNIHTGLQVFNSDQIDRVPLLKRINDDLNTLKNVIFNKIIKKLESVALTAEETSNNLIGILLLQNQNMGKLISTFIQHRKTALNSVIHLEHSAVRLQIRAMVKCLTTTIQLLYDCFMCSTPFDKGLIWKQLSDITGDSSMPTLLKLQLPKTPLDIYIPEIIKKFKPKCDIALNFEINSNDLLMDVWIKDTNHLVEIGLKNCLELVSSLKGLYIIKEEALRIKPLENWSNICNALNLPENFNIWYYFFQKLITDRACILITEKIHSNLNSLQSDVKYLINNLPKKYDESNLKSYIWNEDSENLFDDSNEYNLISMKAQGFSPTIVKVCNDLDTMFLNVLSDFNPYLYGFEFKDSKTYSGVYTNDLKGQHKCNDFKILQKQITEECHQFSLKFTNWIKDELKKREDSSEIINKYLLCIRILQAIPKLCKYFKICCSIGENTDIWGKICNLFNKSSLELWYFWIKYYTSKTKTLCKEKLNTFGIRETLYVLPQWDIIEIQEQAEEEQVVKSEIKVPFKPSIVLDEILYNINDNLCSVLSHTIPKQIHIQFIEHNTEVLLISYQNMLTNELNQNQALQLLFDVKYLTTLCVLKENVRLINISQEICDKLRSNIDPFDLDVFYSYLQTNIKRAVVQSQVIFGCLLPTPMQTANIGIMEKSKEQEKEPSILAVSIPSTNVWFSLLPITAPSYKHSNVYAQKDPQHLKTSKTNNPSPKKVVDTGSSIRSSAASLFGGLTTDWFS